MPTPVAHTLAGVAVYLASTKKALTVRSWDRFLLLSTVFAACFADLDFGLNFLTGENYHHYFTHSIAFSTLFAMGAYIVLRGLKRTEARRDALILGVAYLSHLALDLFSKDTSPKYGLELFWPFSERFVIAPFWIFDDIWRGTLAKLLGLHNWLAVGREVLIVGPVVGLIWWWRHGRADHDQ